MDTTPTQQIKTSKYRYVNLVLFILAGLCNSVPTQAFSSIAPIVTELYQVTELEANLVSLVNAICYPFVIFPVNYTLQVYGLKVGTLLGEMFIIAGVLIRLLINYHFYFFIAGTFVAGLGFCFMLNSPNKFAISWFPVSQIAVINSLCIFSIFASDSIGTFASAAFINKSSSKQDFFRFFAVETGIMVSILLLMAVFFRGKPDCPPNYASTAVRQDYFKAIKSLFKNKNYRQLFYSMTFVFGCLSIFFSSFSWQLKVFGFSSLQTGTVFVIANVMGCIGCVSFNVLLDTSRHKRNCLIYSSGCLFSLGCIYVGLQMGSLYVLFPGSGLFGAFIFPFLTTMTDFGSETAFPVGQALSGGSLILGGQMFGVAAAVTLSIFIFDGKSLWKTRLGCGIEFGIMIAGFACLLFVKQNLQRSQYEKNQAQARSLMSSDFLEKQCPS